MQLVMVLKAKPYLMLDPRLDWNRNAKLCGDLSVLNLLQPWKARCDLSERVPGYMQGV